MFETNFKGVKIRVVQGDITKLKFKVDAIVNPANSFGYMGGGVALAIKNAGGEEIEREAVSKAPIEIGKAVATTAGKLNAKFVIHAPTMKNPAGETDEEKIKLATLAALRCAEEKGVKSIAFPGMGTGVGGIPYEVAAKAMVEAIKEFIRINGNISEILLVGYNEKLAEKFTNVLKD
jgi:O-acetyl-ADP-ribose deacetylase (regulator of RNase III)